MHNVETLAFIRIFYSVIAQKTSREIVELE